MPLQGEALQGKIRSTSVCDMREKKPLLCYVTEIFVLYVRIDNISLPD